MRQPLEGQIALVTGGSSGIGYGVVQALADAGACVAINYHAHGEEAEALAAKIETAGGQAIAIQADVSDEAEIDTLFDTLIRFIRTELRTLLVAGLVIAAGAFFTGPSVTAVRTRSALGSGLGWLRRSGERAGLSTGPVRPATKQSGARSPSSTCCPMWIKKKSFSPSSSIGELSAIITSTIPSQNTNCRQPGTGRPRRARWRVRRR